MRKHARRPHDREPRWFVVLSALGRIAALAATILALFRKWLDS
ncbi:hypothetical protein [Amycolatopsis oliviviridis]|nr:hypothetical protein [Amycolatopsis oliviviridis]